MNDILGAVLAGGQASRFGGDKAMARLGDATLLDHALASLRPYCTLLVVIGRTQAPVPTAPDLPRPGLGPLGGIAGALAQARAQGMAAVLTTACDTPFLPLPLVGRLLAAGSGHAAEAPTVGLWPVTLLDGLLRHLAGGGDRSIRRWAAAAGVPAVLPGVTLANVNTPDDLLRLSGRSAPA